jgi:two-component system sensor histidine kinase/response regulator
MPGIDGWQLASEVTADPRLEGMKLILLTPEGLGSGEAKMKLLKWFQGYLSKPVKRGALLAEVFRVLTAEYEPELAELEPAEEGEAEQIREVAAAPAGGEELGGARILVVEDHEVNQQLFKTILEKLGHRVVLASDGLEAVKAARQGRYDLIFMDIQMPNMNGYDTTRKMRGMGVQTPIIAVTASARQEEQSRAIAAGMNHCLTKPFKKRDLVPVLERWLSGLPPIREEPAGGQEPAGGRVRDAGQTVLDFQKAVEAFLGREDVVRSVLSSFMETVDAQILRIPAALEGGELALVMREAHSMKGGAWNLAAGALGEAARNLEDAARAEDHQAARRAFTAVLEEVRRLKKAAGPYVS